jgi:hypothetical protein
VNKIGFIFIGAFQIFRTFTHLQAAILSLSS